MKRSVRRKSRAASRRSAKAVSRREVPSGLKTAKPALPRTSAKVGASSGEPRARARASLCSPRWARLAAAWAAAARGWRRRCGPPRVKAGAGGCSVQTSLHGRPHSSKASAWAGSARRHTRRRTSGGRWLRARRKRGWGSGRAASQIVCGKASGGRVFREEAALVLGVFAAEGAELGEVGLFEEGELLPAGGLGGAVAEKGGHGGEGVPALGKGAAELAHELGDAAAAGAVEEEAGVGKEGGEAGGVGLAENAVPDEFAFEVAGLAGGVEAGEEEDLGGLDAGREEAATGLARGADEGLTEEASGAGRGGR